MKTRIKKALREFYGNFDTFLENDYETLMVEKIASPEERRQWATYNSVLLELKNNLKNQIRVKQLQYRLTDDENPKNVILEVLNEIKNKEQFSTELERLRAKINNF